tara:strand:- start:381 stop:947 length:567 start_codon:yes stop_codon:yes gene_type:complete
MDPQEYSFDLLRIFIGDYNLWIYLEIILRVVIIMSYTILVIKFIGKRAVGTIDSADVLLIIAMGSCVGDALFYPSIPLLVSITVISLIGLLQHGYTYYSIKYEKVRKQIKPSIVKIVEGGKLIEENFEHDNIDKNEVLMLLREKGIHYLSEIEHAYFEANGTVSVFKYDYFEKKDSILPEEIDEISIN